MDIVSLISLILFVVLGVSFTRPEGLVHRWVFEEVDDGDL